VGGKEGGRDGGRERGREEGGRHESKRKRETEILETPTML